MGLRSKGPECRFDFEPLLRRKGTPVSVDGRDWDIGVRSTPHTPLPYPIGVPTTLLLSPSGLPQRIRSLIRFNCDFCLVSRVRSGDPGVINCRNEERVQEEVLDQRK